MEDKYSIHDDIRYTYFVRTINLLLLWREQRTDLAGHLCIVKCVPAIARIGARAAAHRRWWARTRAGAREASRRARPRTKEKKDSANGYTMSNSFDNNSTRIQDRIKRQSRSIKSHHMYRQTEYSFKCWNGSQGRGWFKNDEPGYIALGLARFYLGLSNLKDCTSRVWVSIDLMGRRTWSVFFYRVFRGDCPEI